MVARGGVHRGYPKDFSVQWVQVSIVHGIDGIGVSLDNVAEMIDTVHGIVNIDGRAVHMNDMATVNGVRDANMDVLQGLHKIINN